MLCTVAPTSSLLSLNTASLADAALAYAQMGLAVFPLVPQQKVPLVPGGFYSATTDVQLIAHWWSRSRWPQANIGIATGKPSGWWVLDVDPRHGGLSSWEVMEGWARDRGASTPLSATLWQLTGGGGIHFVYQEPHLMIEPPNAEFAGYKGIDLKKQGGYVVGAPSIHPQGGVYQWQRDLPPAPFPPMLLASGMEHLQRPSSRASAPAASHPRWPEARRPGVEREQDPAYWLHCALKYAAPGSRHRYALFLAIKLVEEAGCSFEEAESWLRVYVAQVTHLPNDPYTLDDALKCLDTAWWRSTSSACS